MRNDAFLLVYYFFVTGFIVSLAVAIVLAWISARARRTARLKDKSEDPG